MTAQYAALFAEPVPVGQDGEPATASVVALPGAGGWRLTWFDGLHHSPPWGPTWPAARVRDAIAAAQALNRRQGGEVMTPELGAVFLLVLCLATVLWWVLLDMGGRR